MRKFILPLILTAAVGIALLPSAARADGVLYTVPPAYVPAPTYVPTYTYVPPAYYNPAPTVYVAPSYYPVYPIYRGHYERHDYRGHSRNEHRRR